MTSVAAIPDAGLNISPEQQADGRKDREERYNRLKKGSGRSGLSGDAGDIADERGDGAYEFAKGADACPGLGTSGMALLFGKPALGSGLVYLTLSSLGVNLLSLGLPIMTLQVYDRILVNAGYGTLNILVAGVVIVVVLEVLLRIARAHTTAWAGAAFEHKMSCQAYRRLFETDLLGVEGDDIGESLQRFSAIGKLRDFIGGQAATILIDLPFVLLFLALIFYLSGPLVFVPITVLAVFSVMAWIGGVELKQALTTRGGLEDRRFNFIVETLSGIHTVKSMGLEHMLTRRFEAVQAETTRISHRVAFASGGATVIGTLFSEIMMVAMTAAGGLLVIEGQLTIGTLIACVLLSGRIMQPIQRALGIWIRFQDFSLAREKAAEVFSLETVDCEAPALEPAATSRLDIQDVTFGYDAEAAPIFRNVSLRLDRGRSVSIGGAPSCGKSTFLKVLSGLYRPDKGQVLLDGVDVSAIPSDLSVARIGFIGTDGLIFQGTIRDNLTSFEPSNEPAAMEVARLMGIDDVISRLPGGLDTMLNDSLADTVPSGLKQCVAIARVLARKPKFILWDNADRSLDRNSYNAVFQLFGRLKGRVTLVIVSEDRNFLQLADDEYLMADGGLVRREIQDDSKAYDVSPLRELWR